jgi:dTDP-4-amino-4,6-dideoxygalactose transaminase
MRSESSSTVRVLSERIPFNDLALQWREISSQALREFEEVFAKSAFCLGPHVDAFEKEIADFLGVEHAVAVNSGSSALHLAVVTANLGPGDEVLVPAHTFIATLWGVIYVGATPVLCDVDEATGTIDVDDAERRVTPHTRAIIPVHLYGQPADMDRVGDLARRHNLVVIEDAAQAIGARWSGRCVGTIGAIGCFSFYPGKNLGAAGEGGLVVTSDSAVSERLRALRSHGQRDRYVHAETGFNYRMDGLQAVVLRHKLKRISSWTQQRRVLATRYQAALAGLPLDVPTVRNQDHVWHLFVVRSPQRDRLQAYLERAGIETGLHYPVPLHRQPCLAYVSRGRDSYPCADRWASEGLSLPLFYGMTIEQVDRVTETIHDFFVCGRR